MYMESELYKVRQLKRDSFIRYGHAGIYETIVSDIEKILHDEEEREHQDLLIESMKIELDNAEKSCWYSDHFDDWVDLPTRQNCESYPLMERLRYSRCRLDMFDHLEHTFKRRKFPTLANRLEFF
jgi:hypothetical protein